MRDRRIYETDMGVMDERYRTLNAGSLDELLELGTSLMELPEAHETEG